MRRKKNRKKKQQKTEKRPKNGTLFLFNLIFFMIKKC